MIDAQVQEQYDILDQNGNRTGEVLPRSIVHDNELLHGGVQVWLYNSKGEVLLQLRSKSKKIFPGVWDISAAGHISAGETTLEAAVREIEEEIGIRVGPEELTQVGVVHDCVPLLPDRMHPEIVWIYILHKDLDSQKLTLQQSELSAVKWTSISEIQAQRREISSHKMYADRNSRVYDIAFEEIEKILG